jgi:hypothetical protein
MLEAASIVVLTLVTTVTLAVVGSTWLYRRFVLILLGARD